VAEKPKSATNKLQPSVMDVARPGKITPSASSRPIIVGHKPLASDPMVHAQDTAADSGLEDADRTKTAVTLPKKKSIMPIIIDEPAGDEKETVAPDSVPQVSDTKDSAVEAATKNEEEPATATETDKQEAINAAMVQTVVEQAEKAKAAKEGGDNKTDELAKKRQELDKLIESQKYYVPIGQATKKKRRNGLLLALLLLLAAGGAYLALDAQLVKNEISLPHEFLKEQRATDNSASDLPAAAPNEQTNSEQPSAETDEYKVPEGFTLYENKELGFKFAYPEIWRETITSTDAIRGEHVDTFVYNDRGYDSPTYLDPFQKQWYTKDGEQRKYIEVGEDLLRQGKVGDTHYFLFLGKGAQYCGSRHIALLHSKNGTVMLVRSPLVCTVEAKEDPDPNWNQQTYFTEQFEKDSAAILETVREL